MYIDTNLCYRLISITFLSICLQSKGQAQLNPIIKNLVTMKSQITGPSPYNPVKTDLTVAVFDMM